MNAIPIDVSKISLPLVEWYRSSARDLPWRHTEDPYRIWISEIMLQQTRVEAVKPYYARFLKGYPTLGSLAESGEEELFKLWEGLGYYSRARNLLAAARAAVEIGRFPDSFGELLTLKGIGPYTAAAVASIAFGEPVAAVDGNVLRVVSRLCCLEDDVSAPGTRKEIFETLTSAMPQGRTVLSTDLISPFGLARNDPGDFNQAMMELGATVCLPNGAPLCLACPLAALCEGNLSRTAESFPLRTPKRERKIEERTVFVLKIGDRYSIRKRPETGLLAGLWEFPSVTGSLSAEETEMHLRQAGFEVLHVADFGSAKHVFTHIEWRMQGFLVECESLPEDSGLVQATAGEIGERFAMPTAFSAFRKKLI